MEPAEWERAYLNRWNSSGGPAAIDADQWASFRDPASKRGPVLAAALDVSPDRYAWIAVASRRADGRIHVEVVAHDPGTDWVAARAAELQRKWCPVGFMYDPAGPAGSLRLDLQAAGVAAAATDTRSYGQACGAFFDAVVSGEVAHLGQPPLDSAVAAARWRNIGDAKAWARRAGSDISPLVAVTLARWAYLAAGEGRSQIL